MEGDSSYSYEWVVIEGVNCLKTCFDNKCPDVSRRESNKRRKFKDELGEANKDVIMLDSCGAEFCDAIVIVSDLDKLLDFFILRYTQTGYSCTKKTLNGGTQYIWSDPERTFLSLSAYPTKSKVMVQPGDQGPVDLLRWIKDYTIMCKHPGDIDTTLTHNASDNTEVKSVANLDTSLQIETSRPTVIENYDTNEISDTDTDTELNLDLGLYQNIDLDLGLQSGKTEVDLASPSKPTEIVEQSDLPHQTESSKSPTTLDKSTLTEWIGNIKEVNHQSTLTQVPEKTDETTMTDQDEIIVSELLCFVQNKVDTVPLDTLAKLCVEFYTQEEINKSKMMFFDLIDAESRSRCKKNQGPDKSLKDMKDILHLFLQIQVPYKYKFVARNLANIPPLSLLSSDNMKILQEIEMLKSEMKSMAQNQRDFALEMTEIKTVTQQKCIQRDGAQTHVSRESPPHSKQMSRPTVGHSDVTQTNIRKTPSSVWSNITQTTDDHLQQTKLKQLMSPNFAKSRPEPKRAPTTKPVPHVQDVIPHNVTASDSSVSVSDLESETEFEEPVHVYHIPLGTYNRFTPLAPDQKVKPRTFTRSDLQQRKVSHTYSDAVQHQPKQRLKSVRPVSNKTPASHQNRSCTGLFVSRLLPKTSAGNVQKHILAETGLTKFRVEQLKTRYDTYSSFHIRCEKQVLNSLLNPDIWPQGLLIKPFYN